MALDPDPSSARAGGRAFLSLVRTLARFAGRTGVLATVYVALGAIFESIGLVLIIPLLALVFGTGGGHGKWQQVMMDAFASVHVTTRFGRLAAMLGGFAVLMLIRGVVLTLRDRAVATVQVEFVEHLRGRIAIALAGAEWDQVLRLRHARILAIMGADIQRISMATNFLLQAGVAMVLLLTQCVLSFLLSPVLALFAFALLIAGGVAMVPVLRRARTLGQFMSHSNVALVDTATQFLGGLKLALSQDLQGGFVSEFLATIRGLSERQLKNSRQQSVNRVAFATISALVGIVVVLAGYALELSPAVLITFLLIVARMSGPATQIQQGLQQLANGLPSYEAVVALLAELRPGAAAPSSASTQIPDGAIAFEAVTFQHPHGDHAQSHGVRDVSVSVTPGIVLGIAGDSGAGKTTFVDLLVGLLRPQSGRVTVGGMTLDEATLPAWRARLGYISQDPFLFHDTVRRNLAWARNDATEAQMWQALALASADGIVRRMDGGLDAVVGERGSLVSGGERQRIALARALLRRPKLLVMDEATNAIDVAGERVLVARLLALEPRPTIVMIAHRAESLALCDRVIHLENGRLRDDASAQGVAAAH